MGRCSVPLKIFLEGKQAGRCRLLGVQISHRSFRVHRINKRPKHLHLTQRRRRSDITDIWELPLLPLLQKVFNSRFCVLPVTALATHLTLMSKLDSIKKTPQLQTYRHANIVKNFRANQLSLVSAMQDR